MMRPAAVHDSQYKYLHIGKNGSWNQMNININTTILNFQPQIISSPALSPALCNPIHLAPKF